MMRGQVQQSDLDYLRECPHTFGKNARDDLWVIREAWRLVVCPEMEPDSDIVRAFSNVMDSISALFQSDGVVFCFSKNFSGAWKKIVLDSLDSGFLAALDRGNEDRTSLDSFNAAKKSFFEKCAESAALLRSRESLIDRIPRCEDAGERDRLTELSFYADVRLVLLAHEFRANRNGRGAEAALARTLVEIVAKTENSQANALTLDDIIQDLRTAVDECRNLAAVVTSATHPPQQKNPEAYPL